MHEQLDESLIDGLAPPDAPGQDDIDAWHTDVPDDHPARRFQVDDLGAADWAGRKIRQAKAKIGEAQRWRDRIVAEADAHLEREKARHQPTVEFFEFHLTSWLRRELDADPKGAKSRDLPCGLTVRRTAGRPRLVVDDHETLVDFLTSNEDTHELVEAVWKFDANKVKALVTKDGLALKGAHVETGEPGYKVTVGGDA